MDSNDDRRKGLVAPCAYGVDTKENHVRNIAELN